MSNRLTMAQIDAILTLNTSRHSNREIADLLHVPIGTIRRFIPSCSRLPGSLTAPWPW